MKKTATNLTRRSNLEALVRGPIIVIPMVIYPPILTEPPTSPRFLDSAWYVKYIFYLSLLLLRIYYVKKAIL